MAAIVGGEIAVIGIAVLLFFATDGRLFEKDGGLGYYALACLLIFIVGVTFVLPIWAVIHYGRSGQSDRSRSDAPWPP